MLINYSEQRKSFFWFPKETNFNLVDVYCTLFFLGAFGGHQFYLGNKKKGLLVLSIFSLSHIPIAFIDVVFPYLYSFFGGPLTLFLILFGYALGILLLFWDFVTLPAQVKRINELNIQKSKVEKLGVEHERSFH